MITIEGTYKNGQITLTKTPAKVGESKVLVTFLETKEINLRERGIDERQASELRAKLEGCERGLEYAGNGRLRC